MKAKFFTLTLLFVSISAFAQLRVDPYGRIGMGTNYPNPAYKLHIKGDLLLTTYPDIPAPNTTPVEFRFKVGNGWPGAEMGTNIGTIAFWSGEAGYNDLAAGSVYTPSDSSLKTNIKPLTNALEKIKLINSYSYNFKGENEKAKKLKYGFLSQEIEKVLPDITLNAKGVKLLEYQQIIPLLVEGMKEQQKCIDSSKAKISKQDSVNSALQKQINDLNDKINSCCNSNHSAPQGNNNSNNNTNNSVGNIDVKLTDQQSIVLQDNVPNPWAEQTTINFFLTQDVQKAEMLFYNTSGKLIQSVELTQRGNGTLNVFAENLSDGLYTYTLIIDGKIFATKKMLKQ